MSKTAAAIIAPMYSCEGARILRDRDGIAFIEVDDQEPSQEDWGKLLWWVQSNGFSFGHWGPIRDSSEIFDDEYGDRFILCEEV